MRAFIPAILLGFLSAGCGPDAFSCGADEACVASNGGHGRCFAMRCAFADRSCASNFRFDERGGEVAEMCVGAALLPDGGPADAAAAPDGAAVPDAPSAPDAPAPDGALADAPVD